MMRSRISNALPKMARAATCPKLKEALETHLEETLGQIENLEKVFEIVGMKAKGKKCEATVGLLEEGDEIAKEFKGSPAINAALISAGQKVEHYEIASYGCLREWAEMLGHADAVSLLDENLQQEKAADQTLTEIARTGDNEQAKDGDSEDRHEREEAGSRRGMQKQNKPRSSRNAASVAKARRSVSILEQKN